MSSSERASERPGLHVAVIGSTGQLGTDLIPGLEAAGHRVTALGHDAIEITDPASVAAAFERLVADGGLDAVVNCAAFHNVDPCERDGATAFAVNVTGAFLIAEACRRAGARCVYVSTDYVFDGAKGAPYDEDDPPAPINVYGLSKQLGEQAVAHAADRWTVIRISSVFGRAGARGKGGNFVETILKRAREGLPLKVIDDIVMSPTYTRDVAATLPRLLEADVQGVVHLSNAGACTWHEFAQAAVELAGLDVEVAPTPASTWPSVAERPVDSSLTSRRLEDLIGEGMRPWREALEAYLAEKGYLAANPV